MSMLYFKRFDIQCIKGSEIMIYITGDTHIPVDISKLYTKRFPAQKDLSKNDYLIICSDLGGVSGHFALAV